MLCSHLRSFSLPYLTQGLMPNVIDHCGSVSLIHSVLAAATAPVTHVMSLTTTTLMRRTWVVSLNEPGRPFSKHTQL